MLDGAINRVTSPLLEAEDAADLCAGFFRGISVPLSFLVVEQNIKAVQFISLFLAVLKGLFFR